MEPQLPLCGKCGYDLTGLGPIGRCPECGSRYNTATRQGMRRSSSEEMYAADRIYQRVRTILLIILAAIVLACGGFIQSVVTHSRALGVAVVIALVLVLAAISSYVSEKERST